MLSLRLRELRGEADVTQQDMANYLGITRQAYAAYETGTRQPDFVTLAKLAKYFDVTTDFLLGRAIRRREAIGYWVPRPEDVGYVQLPIPLVVDDPRFVADDPLSDDPQLLDRMIFDTSSFMKLISIPVYNRIWANESPYEEFLNYTWITEDETDDGEYFYLKVHQHNMAAAGIRAGGLVLVRRQSVLEDGEIGLVSTCYKQPALITRFWKREDRIILHDDDPRGPYAYPLDSVKIIGKVVESRFRL